MQLEYIKLQAIELWQLLKPYCKQIKIAGSIRRNENECKDIELVAIPDKYHLEKCLKELQYKNQIVFKKNGPKYKQFNYHSFCKVDLFIAHENNFGWIFFIRTGPAVWNIKTIKRLKSKNITSKDGELFKYESTKLSAPDENAVFNLLNMNFIEPGDRY